MKRAAWFAALAALAIFAWASFLSSRSTLFDRDEPRFAEASVEMLDSSNWLYPTFDHELRPDKPILVYWLMAGSIRAFGATAWAARFWSPVCLALACWLVFGIGRRLFDAKAGLIAMGLLAVSPLALMEGVVATTDALLLLCLTFAFSGFAAIVVDGASIMRCGAVALGTAGALLAKGPVGLAIAALSIAFTLWFLRAEDRPTRRDGAFVWLSLFVSVAIFLVWAIPANAATHGEYAARGIGHHVVERSTSALEGHGGSYFAWLPFYVPIVVVGFLPGLLFLPAACVAFVRGDAVAVRGRALILGWSVPCFVLMTLVPTKLPHYVLPIFPALALASGAVVVALERDRLSDRERAWFTSGFWIFACVTVLLAGGLLAAPYFVALDGVRAPAFVFAGCLLALTLASLRALRGGRTTAAACIAILGFASTWLVAVVLILPVVERTKVAPEIAAAINARVPRGVTVARWKFTEPSLDFYLGRPPIVDFENEEELREWAARDSPAVLVLPRKNLENLTKTLPASHWTEIASARGFNLSKGAALELVALGRALPGGHER